MSDTTITLSLTQIYHRLFACYGPQHWWPGDGPFEVIVGAILTQSAAWTNVEKAINNLKQSGALSPHVLHKVDVNELAHLVRPSGYYNAKAKKLKAFVGWLHERFSGDVRRMFSTDTAILRKALLGVHGIGEETADSILLYAGNKPVFVIDAYTRRILSRLGIEPESWSYAKFQSLFMDNLPHDADMFNEYHALLVKLGKDVCRQKPLCERCCLLEKCEYNNVEDVKTIHVGVTYV